MIGLVWELRIVGGEFDGAPGLTWTEGPDMPVPETIDVGVCERGRVCSPACKSGVEHVSYWFGEDDEFVAPERTVAYRKQDEHVKREGDELSGVAVYAVEGLLSPANFGEKARELTPA